MQVALYNLARSLILTLSFYEHSDIMIMYTTTLCIFTSVAKGIKRQQSVVPAQE